MDMYMRHLFIPLLLAVIFSIGLSQAGTNLCPPECGHCFTAKALPSCCDDIGGGSGGAHVPENAGNDHNDPGCDSGSLCTNVSEQLQTIASRAVPNVEPLADYPGIPSFCPSDHPRTFSTFRAKSPPLVTQPPIYTLHCSLLI